jgi:hypothetical protein
MISYLRAGDISMVKKYKPVDCTTNPSLVLKAVQMPEYEYYLSKAIEAETECADCDPNRPFSGTQLPHTCFPNANQQTHLFLGVT